MNRNDSGEYLIQLFSKGTLIDTVETDVTEITRGSNFYQEIRTSTEFEGNWVVDKLALLDKETMEVTAFRTFPYSTPIHEGETLDVTWHFEFRREAGYNTVMKL